MKPDKKPSKPQPKAIAPAKKSGTSVVTKLKAVVRGGKSAEPAPASTPARKPAKRSLIAAAVESVKAVVRRTTRKPKAKAATKPATPATATASGPRIARTTRPEPRKAAVKLPPILLEGDVPPAPKVSGPGDRYVLGPSAPAEKFADDLGELPEAYGTGKLILTARDPHWLYAHWDLTTEQLRKHNRASRDGHLVVRVFENEPAGKPVSEVHVHPESRNWFIHIHRSGARYAAELGYYAKKNGRWTNVSTSRPTLTPPDSLSDDTSVRFATIPVELSFKQMLALLKRAAKDHIPLAEAIQQLRAAGFRGLPDAAAIATATEWTPEQERALAEVVSMDAVRRVWMGSLEITELLRRQLLKELSSMSAAGLTGPSSLGLSSLGVSSLTSPYGGAAQRGKGFWFNVNAELIIYGATEPDATVTIGGRTIKLRSDGTFSYRFALPDGEFNLPAIATNADGDDTRIADLAFSRSTEYGGEVGQHPQDPSLKPPKAEHVA